MNKKKEKSKKFCSTCGSILVNTPTKCFDSYTGKIKYELQCSQIDIDNRHFWDSETHILRKGGGYYPG